MKKKYIIADVLCGIFLFLSLYLQMGAIVEAYKNIQAAKAPGSVITEEGEKNMDANTFQLIGAAVGFGTVVVSAIISYKKDGERLGNSTEKILSNVSGSKEMIIEKIEVGHERLRETVKETQTSLQGLIGDMREQKGKQEAFQKSETDIYQSIQIISSIADKIVQKDAEIERLKSEYMRARETIQRQDDIIAQKDAELHKLRREINRQRDRDEEWEQ